MKNLQNKKLLMNYFKVIEMKILKINSRKLINVKLKLQLIKLKMQNKYVLNIINKNAQKNNK